MATQEIRSGKAPRAPHLSYSALLRRSSLVAGGAILAAVAINLLLVPHELLPGGVSGIAVLLEYLVEVPAGITLALFNVPLFLVAWKHVDRSFALLSMVGLVTFSAALVVTSPLSELDLVRDHYLASIFGGAVSGAGAGFSLRHFGSLGGADIVGVLLRRRLSLKVSDVIYGLNIVTVAMLAFFRGVEPALLTLLSMAAATVALDRVLTGVGRSKAVLIVTTRPAAVAKAVLRQLDRGATLLSGEGAFGNVPRQILFTVIPRRQLALLKRQIEHIDSDAFVTVIDANEVIGRGFLQSPAA